MKKIWRTLRLVGDVLVAAAKEFRADNAQRLSASIAYYTAFSLSPLLVIVVAVAGQVFGAEAIRGEIVRQFSSVVGHGAASQIEAMLVHASDPSSSRLASLLGLGVLILGSGGVFNEIKGALDAIWQIPPPRRRRGGIRGMIRGRLLSLAMVMGVAFLLLVSLVLSAALSAAAKWAGDILPPSRMISLRAAEFGASFLVNFVLFAMIYRILPEARIAWRDVWFGAAVTGFLFNIGKLLIGLYLGQSSVSSVFGAAGSLVVILVWVYYSASIFLFGAEITEIFTRRWGSMCAKQAPELQPQRIAGSGT